MTATQSAHIYECDGLCCTTCCTWSCKLVIIHRSLPLSSVVSCAQVRVLSIRMGCKSAANRKGARAGAPHGSSVSESDYSNRRSRDAPRTLKFSRSDQAPHTLMSSSKVASASLIDASRGTVSMDGFTLQPPSSRGTTPGLQYPAKTSAPGNDCCE